MIATSEVPPPISTTILPITSVTGNPAPSAAAIGSSIRYVSRAPDSLDASYTAFFSTSVAPEGMPITTLGRGRGTNVCWCALLRKYPIKSLVTSYSDITPSRNGRMAICDAGVLPTISFACKPIFSGWRVFLSITTQEGSLITIPLPRTLTKVLAVPRSIPISKEKSPNNQLSGRNAKLILQN